jgi:hypothetical protein
MVTQTKQGLYHNLHQMNFFPLPQRFLVVYTNKQTIVFINVLTWHGRQKALVAIFLQFYIPSRQKGESMVKYTKKSN